MTKSSVRVVLIALLAAVPAFAGTTGNDVLKTCQTAVRFVDNNGAPTGELFDSGWCFGWVNSALELTKLHNDWTSLAKQKPTLLQFCIPDSGIPTIQVARILVKYLKEHPEQLHGDGMGLTLAALKDAFPCK
jgi:hypothetical protein